MEIIRMIMFFIVALMVLALAVAVIDGIVPITIKADFDRICDKYLAITDSGSGITVAQIDALTNEIEARATNLNVTLTNISRVGTVPHLGDLVFEVEAQYTMSKLIAYNQRQNKTVTLRYYRTWPNKRISN